MDVHSMHYNEEQDAQGMDLNTPEIAVILVDILKCSSDLETIKEVAQQLQFLSQDPSVLWSIYLSNGIPVLVELLSNPDESVSFYAVKTLRNLLFSLEGSKAAVCQVGGLEKMVMTLQNNDVLFLSVVVECLHILAYQNPDNKFLIYRNDGPAELVRIMETYSCKILLLTTVRVLLVLSVCSWNKRAIIAAGGMRALAKHLDDSCQKLLIKCLLTLRNLSDAAAGEENVEPLLKTLVQLLRSRDKNIICYVTGILSNMTCNHLHNKVLICRERGVHALMRAILISENDEEIIESAICALRHLTNQHLEAEKAQNDVRLHFGLQAIVKCFNLPIRWPLIKDVIGLVGNLALCPNNHELLLGLGIVHNLRELLHSVYQDILRNRESLPCYKMQPTVIDGVKLEDIVELILIAFRNLIRNANIRTLLKQPNTMNTFIQIMNKENKNLQFIVSGIYRELAANQKKTQLSNLEKVFCFLVIYRSPVTEVFLLLILYWFFATPICVY